MMFSEPLTPAMLIRRHKRFLADVELADGRILTAHCPNTGSMMGCADPNARVWLSRSDNPKRKYAYTWELVEVAGGTLVGINTGRTNRLIEEAIVAGDLPELGSYDSLRREVRYGRENSRVDFLLRSDDAGLCYLEVKNVTAAVEKGIALFPDAVSSRGARHLRELMAMVADNRRAVICFCVQRGDVREVRPADAIDPVYGATLRQAVANGVEAIACGAEVSPRGIEVRGVLPVVLP
jgi:sugar fermentation stimulation protein A